MSQPTMSDYDKSGDFASTPYLPAGFVFMTGGVRYTARWKPIPRKMERRRQRRKALRDGTFRPLKKWVFQTYVDKSRPTA